MRDSDASTDVAAFLESVTSLVDGSAGPSGPTDPDADLAEDRSLVMARARVARNRATELGEHLDGLWERYEVLRREFQRAPSAERRTDVELATGVTMAVLGLSAQRARHLLAVLAWRRDTSLDELASQVVSGASGDPGAFLRGDAGPEDQQPIIVRRAVRYMKQNARSAIRTEDAAAAAGIGTRGLQHAFRRYCGCTPTEYLRRLRLDGAHRELLAADPTRGDTVAAIADRWNFTHHGRFSVEYREMYGRSPRESLRH